MKSIKMICHLKKGDGKGFQLDGPTIVIMCIVIVSSVSLHFVQNSPSYTLASPQPRENITMTIMFNQFQTSGKHLVDSAADILRSNHPDLGINMYYIETGNETRNQMLSAISNGTSVDIITLDQIWLAEFAQKGLLTDLTNYTKKWGHLSNLYLDGMTYNGSIYGVWTWTDVRGI
jgi:multiple sugar transport system substrate-binding protein